MSFLARASLANRSLVALIALVVVGLGFVAIPALKQQLLPSVEYPAAVVVAPYPGAGPEIVETRVVRPIESAVRGVAGLNEVTSTASDGLATMRLTFELGTGVDDVVDEVRSALNGVRQQLPGGVDPQVVAGGTDDVPAVVLAAAVGTNATAEAAAKPAASTTPGASPVAEAGGDDAEREFVERLRRIVLPELESIDGVGRTELAGVREEVVVITPDPARMAAARVAPTAIGTALTANGVMIPAGSLVSGDRALSVRAGTPIRSMEDLRGIWLAAAPGARSVTLKDVATVERRLAPATSLTRTNGVPSMGIVITAAPDGNAVRISHQVRDRLDELSAALGGKATLTVVFDQAPFVEKSIDNLTTEGLLGLLMAVVVILLFLLSLRSTLVTAVSIPLSVVVALIALWLGDQSLNLLTLGALTIAVGRVVDDSIVVLENIKRHMGYGGSKRQAITDGVREVAGAVTASTLTTVAVFAPIALVDNFVGELFAPFALTVTVALLASLLVSLTVIPVLAYWFLRPARGRSVSSPTANGGTAPVDGAESVDGAEAVRRAAREREPRSPLQRAYLPVLRFATRRRVATLLIGVLVLVGTFGLTTQLETNFLDQSGQDTFTVSQEMPAGTSLAATDAAARRVEQVLESTDEVESYQVTVGQSEMFGFAGSGGANAARFQVTVREESDAEQARDAVRDRLGGLVGAGELTVGGGSGGAFSSDRLEVVVRAVDTEALNQAAEQVRATMVGAPGVTDVTSGLAESAPRADVVVDRAAAAQRGLSEAGIAQLVGQAFRGAPLGSVTLDGREQDVVLAAGRAPDSLDALRALPIPTATGPVPLDAVANVAEVAAPVRITRIDGNRSVIVSGTATKRNVGEVTKELTSRLAKLDLPAGASYTIGGVSADQEEAFADLLMALLVAIAIVFVIMAATFRSLVQPLILLVSVPFAATGAIGLLLVTGTPLGVPALIGMLMLVGIVVTNAIVLLDLINQYRAQGMDVYDAVIEGGRRRLRPILMTAIATIFALLPMALGFTGDEGGFISRSLAIVVIGGLFSSTLLTLVLVPTLYTMVESAKRRSVGRRWNRRARAGAGEDAVAVAAPTGGSADSLRLAGNSGSVEVLREKTDQFEVLRLPRANRSPLHRKEP